MTGDFGVAVHALLFLNKKKTYVNSVQLSQNICTNPARVRKIMAKLKLAGLIETREGFDGGYLFSKDIKKITLMSVADSVSAKFVSVSKSSGGVDMKCQIASGIGPVMNQLYEQLDQSCVAKLKEITLYDIDKQIFKDV